MGISAGAAMLIGTAISAAGAAYQSHQSGVMQQASLDQQGRESAAQTREAEIKRLQQFKRTTSENLARQSAGGLAGGSGTLDQINTGNIENLNADVNKLQLTRKANESYFNQAKSMAKKTTQVGILTNLAASGISAYGGYQALQQTTLPTQSLSSSTPQVGVANPAQYANKVDFMKPVNPYQSMI